MPQKKPEIDGADEEQIRYALEIIGRGDEFDRFGTRLCRNCSSRGTPATSKRARLLPPPFLRRDAKASIRTALATCRTVRINMSDKKHQWQNTPPWTNTDD